MTPDPFHLARAAEDAGRLACARLLYEAALARQPDRGPALISHARNLISLLQYELAAQVLDHAECVLPPERLHLAFALRGHLAAAKGELAAAIACFMQAHEREPGDATYLIYAASTAMGGGDVERAMPLARKATTCSEGCIEEAFFNLGGCLLFLGRYAEARDCYLRALEIDPAYELARKRLTDVEQAMEILQSGEWAG